MTLEEAEFLIMATDEIKEKARSGELLELTTWMRDFHVRKQGLITTTYDQLDRVMQQVNVMEAEIIEDLTDEVEELQSLNKDDGATLQNLFSAVDLSTRSFEVLVLLEGYVEKNPKADDVAIKLDALRQLMGVRAAVAQSKADIQKVLLDKETEDNLSNADYLSTVADADAFAGAAEGSEVSGEALTLLGQVESTRSGDMASLFALLSEHDSKSQEMNETFVNFCDYSKSKQPLATTDNFKNELLKFMAGNIFVRDSRDRYQKEQMDRFVASNSVSALNKGSITLREFAQTYARLIDTLVDASHNFRSPKIQANYDDF